MPRILSVPVPSLTLRESSNHPYSHFSSQDAIIGNVKNKNNLTLVCSHPMKPNHSPYKASCIIPFLQILLPFCLSWGHGPIPPQIIFKFSSSFSSFFPSQEHNFLLSKANHYSCDLDLPGHLLEQPYQLSVYLILLFFPLHWSCLISLQASWNCSPYPKRAFPWYTTP